MEILFFDTETTGLLKPSPADISQQPYIIEFYAVVTDGNFNIIREYEQMFSIDFELDPIITKITGINNFMLKGKSKFSSNINELSKFFTGVDAMVAHNLPFDLGMLANELIRSEKLIKFPWPRHQICTVERSMSIKGHRLKLSELYKIMTGKEHVNAHRSKNDVMALLESFKGLCKNGFIDIEELNK